MQGERRAADLLVTPVCISRVEGLLAAVEVQGVAGWYEEVPIARAKSGQRLRHILLIGGADSLADIRRPDLIPSRIDGVEVAIR